MAWSGGGAYWEEVDRSEAGKEGKYDCFIVYMYAVLNKEKHNAVKIHAKLKSWGIWMCRIRTGKDLMLLEVVGPLTTEWSLFSVRKLLEKSKRRLNGAFVLLCLI